MPHFIVEYSANIESSVDMAQLCELIRATAEDIDTFPMPGIRVRAIKVDHYAIADGNPEHAYIDVSVRLRGGRALDVRKAATQTLFDAVRAFLEPTLAERSLALSFEMRDIDPELSPKCGSIREHLPEN
jgi:5-carboxymethyl-2-hydroxymuconate isomerase